MPMGVRLSELAFLIRHATSYTTHTLLMIELVTLYLRANGTSKQCRRKNMLESLREVNQFKIITELLAASSTFFQKPS